MRPFRFAFMLTLGVLFFFFIARFLFFALVVGALLSLVFLVGRKARGYAYYRRQQPVWKDDLLVEYPIDLATRQRSERIIEVR